MKKQLTLCLLLLTLCLPFTVKSQYAGKHYIMHGSGLHLAKSAKSGIIESASAADPQIMNITDAGNGYFRIQAPDGTYMAKSGANAWNTGFISDSGSDAVLFQFEENGKFLKIKNKASGKYLG
ncbi:MAG: RICIN domain-containing protein, partial [Muribaculaceae bacterium]|nr:RICIN domain-containing protein [Muribaculaceae bacterium]